MPGALPNAAGAAPSPGWVDAQPLPRLAGLRHHPPPRPSGSTPPPEVLRSTPEVPRRAAGGCPFSGGSPAVCWPFDGNKRGLSCFPSPYPLPFSYREALKKILPTTPTKRHVVTKGEAPRGRLTRQTPITATRRPANSHQTATGLRGTTGDYRKTPGGVTRGYSGRGMSGLRGPRGAPRPVLVWWVGVGAGPRGDENRPGNGGPWRRWRGWGMPRYHPGGVRAAMGRFGASPGHGLTAHHPANPPDKQKAPGR
jgi:hypothetical protein